MIPVFFTDRDLGNTVPDRLREAGIEVRKHSECFPPDARDEDWLTQVGREGWFCLTRDSRIRYKPNQIDAVMRGQVGLFILVARTLRHEELAHKCVKMIHKIYKFIARHRRPFIAKIRFEKNPDPKSRKSPGHVHLWISYDEWVAQNQRNASRS